MMALEDAIREFEAHFLGVWQDCPDLDSVGTCGAHFAIDFGYASIDEVGEHDDELIEKWMEEARKAPKKYLYWKERPSLVTQNPSDDRETTVRSMYGRFYVFSEPLQFATWMRS
jgi:hypothetical protein